MEHVASEDAAEERLELFVLIPDCVHCRRRIESEILQSGLWERVEIGYSHRDGSSVSLIYRKGKFPEVDYWGLAEDIKARLSDLGYRVL